MQGAMIRALEARKTKSREMPELEEGILRFLDESDGPKTALDIQFEMLPGVEDRTCRQIRRAIKRLNDYGLPVVSTSAGFKLAKTWDEVGAYRANLLRRARKIMDRVAALDNIPAGFSVPAR